VTEFTSTKFDLIPKVLRNFEQSGKEIQVRYEVFNGEVLKYVAEFGSRVLHLTSDVFDPEFLGFEGSIGLCKKMNETELQEFIK
jgi:hypothetical protein